MLAVKQSNAARFFIILTSRYAHLRQSANHARPVYRSHIEEQHATLTPYTKTAWCSHVSNWRVLQGNTMSFLRARALSQGKMLLQSQQVDTD